MFNLHSECQLEHGIAYLIVPLADLGENFCKKKKKKTRIRAKILTKLRRSLKNNAFFKGGKLDEEELNKRERVSSLGANCNQRLSRRQNLI